MFSFTEFILLHNYTEPLKLLSDYLDPTYIHRQLSVKPQHTFYVSSTFQPFRPVWVCSTRAGQLHTARPDRSGGSCDWSSRPNRRSWSWGWGSCRRPTRLNNWSWRTWGRYGEDTQTRWMFPLRIQSVQEMSAAVVPCWSILNLK